MSLKYRVGLQWLLLFLLSQNALSKVAYIPLFDASLADNSDSYVFAVDLSSGQLLKRIHVGEGVGAIFINALGDNVYAAAAKQYKIVYIDAHTLEIKQQWQNLPVRPEQIVLTSDEKRLYFAEHGVAEIYELDLSTGSVDMVLSIDGFREFYYSENLEYLVIQSYQSDSGEYRLYTYQLNELALLYQTLASDQVPILIDDNGENYYLSLWGNGRIQSRSLIDNGLNWYFYHGSGVQGPLGELPERFTTASLINDTTLLVSGAMGGSYEVDRISGAGLQINNLINFWGMSEHIDPGLFLRSNPPLPIICPPLLPCEGGFEPLQLFIQNHQTGHEQLVYQRVQSGNLARGRYIGELFYSVPTIPTLHISGLLMFISLIIGLTVYFEFKSPVLIKSGKSQFM